MTLKTSMQRFPIPAASNARLALARAKRAANQAIADARANRLVAAVMDRGLPAPAREWPFMLDAPEKSHRRKWRFDLAWLELRVAVEIEGGTWTHGRHTRGKGFAADCEKYNAATAEGWKVFRFTSDTIDDDLQGCACLIVLSAPGLMV